MNRIRLFVICLLAVGALGVSAATAQACEKTWNGGSGNWGTAGAWTPSGVPGSGQSVCITAAGTYTVTLPANGGVAKSLTVGGASGVQTIDVPGESWDDAGDTSNVTALSAETATFAANTRLILDATGKGSAKPEGAGGYLVAGTVAESGQIETESSDAAWANRIKVNDLSVKPGGSIADASGTLLFIEEGEGAYPWSVTNEGTLTVDPGSSTEMQPSFAGKAGFVNDGSVVNDGSITLHGAEWTQQSGAVSGNPVTLQSGSSLADSAGAGAFLFNYGTVVLTGTIPAGQTVTVRGEPFNYNGETYYSTTLNGENKELTNDGTLVLNPTGSGEVSGGAVNVGAGSIHNNGMIVVETETATRVTQLLDGLTNGPSGRIELTGGILQGNNGAALSNEGLVTLAPGSVYELQEGASFVNEPGGTFSPEIAGGSSLGAVQLTGACCNGPGKFTAGGTLAPALVSGFIPTAGQEFDLFGLDGGKFEGTFATVAGGFSPDYAHESSEPAFVGVVFGGAPGGGAAGGKGTGGSPAPVVHVGSVSGSGGRITAKLSCPAGATACATASLRATVTEHLRRGRIVAVTARKAPVRAKTVVIATGSISLAAAASRTFTLTLNTAGRALLARYGKLTVLVTISSAGKTLDRLTVHLVKPAKPKKK